MFGLVSFVFAGGASGGAGIAGSSNTGRKEKEFGSER